MRRRKSKKIGRNALCWCGSGKKHKRCHLGRGAQPALGRQDAIERYSKGLREGRCLHPQAGPNTCSGRVIAAHTIQRNRGLDHIAREGHVGNLFINPSKYRWGHPSLNWDVQRVGVRQASTFKGFCSHHDNELFAPVDDKPFSGDLEQILLLGYRSICHELYLKRFALNYDAEMREFDRGKPVRHQHALQDLLSIRDYSINSTIRELNDTKKRYEYAIFNNNSVDFSYFVVFLDRHPDLLSSGALHATHDFQGNHLNDLSDVNVLPGLLAFTLIVSGTGGAAVFSCPSNGGDNVKVLSTLSELSDDELPHAVVRFAFEFFENTYFSLDWWDGLDNDTKISLKERQLTESDMVFGQTKYPRHDHCLVDDGIRAVDWEVNSRIVSIDGVTAQASLG